MRRHSFIIKSTDTDRIRKGLVEFLNTSNLFTEVPYYLTVNEASGFSAVFLRGYRAPSYEYAKILSSQFKTHSIYFQQENLELRLNFFYNGALVFVYTASPPIEKPFGTSFLVKMEGDLDKLEQFCVKKEFDKQKLEDVLACKYDVFFYTEYKIIGILNELGLKDLSPVAYWNYEKIAYYYRVENDLEKLIKEEEFSNLSKDVILPSY